MSVTAHISKPTALQAADILLRWPRAAPLAALVSGGDVRAQNSWSIFAAPRESVVIDGTLSVEQAIERTRIATHRLIRMQASWFRADDPRIEWVAGTDGAAAVAALERAAQPPVP